MLGAQLLVAVTAQSVAAVEAEVSLPQLRVLVILASRGTQTLNAVARSLDIHPSNATRACDKLVEGGLIRRAEHSDDRRLLQLSLTERGHELIGKVMDHRREQIAELLTRLPSQERRELASALRTLATSGEETLERAAWQSGWTTAPRDPVSP
jgi:DNA-binding MarR family transcriptional regulator